MNDLLELFGIETDEEVIERYRKENEEEEES